jgi:hypothetical protein
MFVPFVDQFKRFGRIFHSLPFEQLVGGGLSANAVQDRRHDQQQSKESRCGYLVPVQDARQANAETNAQRHDKGKDHRAEILDGVENNQLA